MGARFRFWASRQSLPAAWLAPLHTKAGDVESNPGPMTHTNKHTPVIWICDLCHKQIKKQRTSIRCNHTHNTHWVHLNCTQIKQRQYKHDWRCTRQHNNPSQTNHHPTTHRQQSTKGQKHRHTSNQYKRHQKRNRERPSTQHPTGHYHNTRNKLTQKAKTPKIPHYTTIRTDREHK